jgi:integrase
MRGDNMSAHKIKFVYRNAQYYFRQGNAYIDKDRIIIGLLEEDTDIIYPHPITKYIYKKHHRKAGSINTELTAAKAIVPFLNYILEQVRNKNDQFKDVNGLTDLKVEHANCYLEQCVSEKANKIITLESKERYLSCFYRFLFDEGILKRKPKFIKVTSYYKNKERTSYALEFVYTKTDETYLRERVKRKDMVPQQHQSKDERKIIRLNYIREFLLIALAVAPDIAFAVALQYYGGLRAGEVLNLLRSSIVTQDGAEYGQRGMVLLVRDRQKDLYPFKKSRTEEQVKRPRDQSVLIDPILCMLYEHHKEKVLKQLKKPTHNGALFYDNDGKPMSYSTYYRRFNDLKTFYSGVLLGTPGRYQDYKDFAETKWSTHIGRGAFTNMCLDAGFSARQTAILRGDRSIGSMEAYKDQISATFNITKALGLLEPTNANKLVNLNVSAYQKYRKDVEMLGSKAGKQ